MANSPRSSPITRGPWIAGRVTPDRARAVHFELRSAHGHLPGSTLPTIQELFLRRTRSRQNFACRGFSCLQRGQLHSGASPGPSRLEDEITAITGPSAEHPFLQLVGGWLGTEPDGEDSVGKRLPLEQTQLRGSDGERRAFSREVRKRERASLLHVWDEREHALERGLRRRPVLDVGIETFVKGLDQLRLRQIS